MTAPFFWRRRAPVAVAVLSIAALTLASLAWHTPDNTVFPTAVIVLALYSLGAHGDLRRSIIGMALVLAPVLVLTVVREHTAGDFFFIAVMAGSVWIAGRAVRRHGARAVSVERDSEQKARTAVAEERARIARELHDIVAHSVSVMTIQAGAERKALGSESASTRETLLSIEQTGRQALGEMRRLLGMLRRDDEELELAPQPGMAHIDVLVDQIREAGLPVQLLVEGDPVALPPGVDLSAYRIVQEALTNALKHAGPARASVTVRYLGDELELEIADSGAGGGDGHGGGHGLVGMRERVSLYGGHLDAGARPGAGYTVQARLPLAGGTR